MLKKFIPYLWILGFFLPASVFAASCSDSCSTTDTGCYNNVIQACTSQIDTLRKEANTLSNQIAAFNAQIYLGNLKIQQTQDQINLLKGRITQVQGSLDDLSKAFAARVVTTYKMARTDEAIFLLLSSSNLSEAISKYHYLKEAENSDQNLLVRLQSAQTTYENSKKESEDLQKQLQNQQASLNAQKTAKAQLLAQTQGSEAIYQNLLSQAQAQLSKLAGFAESVGVSLIPHQDLSDGWGKYYNQRDSDWGNVLVNGSNDDCRGGSCTIARIGCLVTSYTMVSSHFGASLTPKDVAVNSANFYLSTADFLNPGPSANGHSPTRLDNPSLDDIKSKLQAGAVIIAGLSANGGPYPTHYSDHWVVLRSIDGDNIKINDPLYAGAMNVSLNDHYSGWTIIQANVYY